MHKPVPSLIEDSLPIQSRFPIFTESFSFSESGLIFGWYGVPMLARWFEQDVLEHLEPLYRFALFLHGECRAAGNAVETAYLQTLQEHGTLRRSTNAKITLFRSVYEAAASVRSTPERASSDSGSSAWNEPLVTAALFRLPPALRSVVLLEILGLDGREIAAVLGIPARAVATERKVGWDMFLAECAKQVARCN